ncbi:MAG: hypothetical protein A2017_18170 [Lentisphaerae bacterium GWF2_44_16]|nr:MAG: hypothetical protein A2017_18170 [Lentisphaerae bacterium GWF2_44_16]
MVSIERQIACVKREIKMRENVYPKWVLSGRMSVETSKEEIEAMKGVLETLQEVERKESGDLFNA